MNFMEEEKVVALGKEEYVDMSSGEKVINEMTLGIYEVRISKNKSY